MNATNNNIQQGSSAPWSLKPAQLFAEFHTTQNGLASQDANMLLKENGYNEIRSEGKREAIDMLVGQFKNPLVLVLIFASVVSFFLGDTVEGGVILAIVIINALLGFFQEYRAEKTLVELSKYVSMKAKVVRDGEKKEIDSRELTEGDVVYLSIGDIIPADIRILDSEEFSTNESALTGESVPAEKNAKLVSSKVSLPQHLSNMAFMGTSVASGMASGLVVATGEKTFFGKTAARIKEAPVQDSFQKNISSFSKLLLKIIVIMVAFIFLANAILGKGVFDSFLFALALAVGITPEALPMIITITLSRNARKMAKEKVIVKKLDAIEDLGNMDTLCSDKTGTLTEGKLRLINFFDLNDKREPELALLGLLCNSENKTKGTAFGNPIDRAIIESHESQALSKEIKEYSVIDMSEFDFERKRMSVTVKKKGSSTGMLIAKGAPEAIMGASSFAQIFNQKKALSPALIAAMRKKITGYEEEGYNVIAIATKEVPAAQLSRELKKTDEKELTLLGFLIFLDPPKESAKEAVQHIARLGVNLKILTGDSPIIAKKICKEVGLAVNEGRVITGEELEALNGKEFEEYCSRFNVFARVTPDQKYKIVLNLNKEGHVVGFLGDGINDAPALKAADVGISVDSAAGIAKEAADIILLQKNLHAIASGIHGGRKAFSNITKYVLNATSSNYGNMFTVALSSLFLPFIPLLPSQILLENLLSDMPFVTISTDNVDEELLKRPRKWSNKLIFHFMIYFGILSVVFDLIMIGALLFIFSSPAAQFRTAWFIESILTEIIIAFSLRTTRTFFKSKPSKLFIASSVFVAALSIALVFSSIGSILFSFEAVPPAICALVAIIIAAYFAATELVKREFFKKYEM